MEIFSIKKYHSPSLHFVSVTYPCKNGIHFSLFTIFSTQEDTDQWLKMSTILYILSVEQPFLIMPDVNNRLVNGTMVSYQKSMLNKYLITISTKYWRMRLKRSSMEILVLPTWQHHSLSVIPGRLCHTWPGVLILWGFRVKGLVGVNSTPGWMSIKRPWYSLVEIIVGILIQYSKQKILSSKLACDKGEEKPFTF